MAAQTEFPMQVPICAWCKPEPPDAHLGSISHGICPRHLRKLKLEARGVSSKRRRRSPRVSNDLFLPLAY